MSFGNRNLSIAQSRYCVTLNSDAANFTDKDRPPTAPMTEGERETFHFKIPFTQLEAKFQSSLVYLRAFYMYNKEDTALSTTCPAVEVRLCTGLLRSGEQTRLDGYAGQSTILSVVPMRELGQHCKGNLFTGSAATDGKYCSLLPGQSLALAIGPAMQASTGGFTMFHDINFVAEIEFQLLENEHEDTLSMK